MPRFIKLLRGQQVDVVYSFLPTSNVLAACAKPFLQGRVIWGVRASQMRDSSYDWLGRFLLLLERHLARVPDAIIVNSEAGLAHHRARGYPASRMVVVTNGVDVARYSRSDESRLRVRSEWGVQDRSVVGVVCRLDPMKGLDVFLRAAAIARQARSDLFFVIVGDGAPGYAQTLKRLANDLGLHACLRWEPARDNVVPVLCALDVLCVSSIYGEGFSNVLCEALLCGTPCVATDVGDCAAILGSLGGVVPPNDEVSLARELLVAVDGAATVDRGQLRAHATRKCALETMIASSRQVMGHVVSSGRWN